MPLLALKNGVCKAGSRAEVAGGAVGLYHHDKRVFVAIGRDRYDMLKVAAGLAFQPQFLPRTAPEAGEFFFKRDLQTLAVHVGKRQHALCHGVHDDGGDQPLFVEFQFIQIHLDHGDVLSRLTAARGCPRSRGPF